MKFFNHIFSAFRSLPVFQRMPEILHNKYHSEGVEFAIAEQGIAEVVAFGLGCFGKLHFVVGHERRTTVIDVHLFGHFFLVSAL